jgi:hypothetical protein
MTNDPFAAASVATPAAPVLPTTDDPFNGVSVDLDDPFADSDTVNKAGNFRPTPGPEALHGRLVAYIPQSYRKDAPVPAEFAKTQGEVREQWTADMYVLDRRDFSYVSNRTDQKTQQKTQETTVIPAAEMPAEFPNVFVPQQAIIGQLRKVNGTAKPILMGVMRRGPKGPDRKAGKTFADIEREYATWMENMGRGIKTPEPGFSWQVDVEITPAQRAEVMAWWGTAKNTVKLTVAQDTTGTGR